MPGWAKYLTSFAFGSATLDDLIGCWSRASGCDLAGWGRQWLRTEGVPTIWLDDEGAVRQDVPRWQRVGIGLFDADNGNGQLRRRKLLAAELNAERTAVPELASAAAVVLNDQDSRSRELASTRDRGKCWSMSPARWAIRSPRRSAGTGSGC